MGFTRRNAYGYYPHRRRRNPLVALITWCPAWLWTILCIMLLWFVMLHLFPGHPWWSYALGAFLIPLLDQLASLKKD